MSMAGSNRRQFLRNTAGATVSGAFAGVRSLGVEDRDGESFAVIEAQRRRELWSLLGELPGQHGPGPAKVLRTEKHEGYTLERLILDLNGEEPVPALLLIPDKRQTPAPGLLYVHWHGGMYDLGKEQLLGE